MDTKLDKLVSYSRIRSFLSCPYRYNLSYNENVAPRVDDRAPALGGAGHVGMAAGILGKNVDEALEGWANEYIATHSILTNDDEPDADIIEMARYANDVTQELVDDVLEKASFIVPEALKFLDLDRWETVVYNGTPLVEARFEIPMEFWGGYVAIIDWVAKDKETGAIWLVDHKFRKQLQSDEVEEFNLQMKSYQYVLATMGINTVGSISNQILAKLPSVPTLNKDGSMSRAKVATTWDIYRGALMANGLNVDDYLEMKDKLTTEFFRMSYSYVSNKEAINSWNEIIQKAASEMANGNPKIRNLGSLGCRSCWARDYCMEELRGGDLEYLMSTKFMPKIQKNGGDPIEFVEEGEA